MIFFDSWSSILRIAVTAILTYPFIILVVRVAGKRSTGEMNNFDWIVTVAVGSIMGSAIISRDVVLADVYLAFALLFGLQYLATFASSRSEGARRALRAPPRLLLYRGEFQNDALLAERVSRKEVESAVRGAGYGGIDAVCAVVLESNANFSVIPHEQAGSGGLLAGLSVPAQSPA